MIKCEMSDITVPAHAEIVIEGEIQPGIMEDEGPFCEFHGIYSTGVAKKPALDVKAITMREDAIFRHLNATPFTDHQSLVALPGEALLYDRTIGLPYDLSLPDLPGAPPLRVGSTLGIDDTTPPLLKKELRSKMERVSPKGWGKFP